MKEKISKRVELLQRGADLTSGDRDAIYGDPNVNLECFGNLVSLFLDYSNRNQKWNPFVGAHGGAMINVLSKVSRIACGAPHEDNYVDGLTYFAIAGEAASWRFQPPADMAEMPGMVLGPVNLSRAEMNEAKVRAPKHRPTRKR